MNLDQYIDLEELFHFAFETVEIGRRVQPQMYEERERATSTGDFEGTLRPNTSSDLVALKTLLIEQVKGYPTIYNCLRFECN